MKIVISENQLNKLKSNLKENENDIDYLLDKWNESGKDSLTPYEKNYLTKKTNPIDEGLNYLMDKYKNLTELVREIHIEPHYDDLFGDLVERSIQVERVISKGRFVIAYVSFGHIIFNEKIKEDLVKHFGVSDEMRKEAEQWAKEQNIKTANQYYDEVKSENPDMSDDEVRDISMKRFIGDVFTNQKNMVGAEDYTGYTDNKFNINDDQIEDIIYKFIYLTGVDLTFDEYKLDSDGKPIGKIYFKYRHEIDYESDEMIQKEFTSEKESSKFITYHFGGLSKLPKTINW